MEQTEAMHITNNIVVALIASGSVSTVDEAVEAITKVQKAVSGAPA